MGKELENDYLLIVISIIECLPVSDTVGRILSLCWHKDGQVLVAGGSDGTIRVYEVSTGTVITWHRQTCQHFFHCWLPPAS